MPIIKSAAKRMRQNSKRARLNNSYKRKMREATKEFYAHVDNNKSTEAKTSLDKATGAIDKAVKQGIIHKNTASRRKSRLHRDFTKAFPKAKNSSKKASTGNTKKTGSKTAQGSKSANTKSATKSKSSASSKKS